MRKMMRKIDQILENFEETINKCKYISDQIDRMERFIDSGRRNYYKEIQELTAKNAKLQTENELYKKTLTNMDDTQIITYKRKRYRIEERILKNCPDEVETLEILCVELGDDDV